MAKKKKLALTGLKIASESALIKMISCTVNLNINHEAKKLKAVIEDRESGIIYEAAADMEVR